MGHDALEMYTETKAFARALILFLDLGEAWLPLFVSTSRSARWTRKNHLQMFGVMQENLNHVLVGSVLRSGRITADKTLECERSCSWSALPHFRYTLCPVVHGFELGKFVGEDGLPDMGVAKQRIGAAATCKWHGWIDILNASALCVVTRSALRLSWATTATEDEKRRSSFL